MREFEIISEQERKMSKSQQLCRNIQFLNFNKQIAAYFWFMNAITNTKPIVTWLFAGCFLIFSMVILGGITRLTGSGLSITEWDVIMGTIPPMNQDDWNIAFDKYKQSPQYQKVNTGMDVEQFKSIFYWEYFHRLVGRLLGVVFIIPFLYFLINKMLNRSLIRRLIIVFLLGGLQGFLGWYMVESGLINNPHVSHYRLALHLITAFITFGYTLWIAMDLIYQDKKTNTTSVSKLFRNLVLIISVLVIIQIIYGAFTAGLHGGKVYNTFPKMGDEWFPSTIVAMTPLWTNFFENFIGVQFIHRYLGTLLVLLGFGLVYLYRKQPLPELSSPVLFFILALVVQFTLGVTTLLYAAPITLAALHQIGGFVLFSSIVFLANRTFAK